MNVVRCRRRRPVLQLERVEKSGGAIYKNATDGAALAYLDGSRPGDFGWVLHPSGLG